MIVFHLDECKIEKKLNILDTKLSTNDRIVLWNILYDTKLSKKLRESHGWLVKSTDFGF